MPTTQGSAQRSVSGMLARLRRAEDGFAAVEFAMIVPIMVVLFLGAVEFSAALTVDRRVTSIASATADLVAQSEQVTDDDLNDIMTIADSLMGGNIDPAPLTITIASLSADAAGTVRVDWSYDRNRGQPYAPGSNYPNVPNGLIDPLTSVIVADVTYDYDPPVGHYIAGSIHLSERFYLRPRKTLKVDKVAS